MKITKNKLKIVQIHAVMFKGDALSNIMRTNDNIFKEKKHLSYLIVDLFSEIPNVSELVGIDYDHNGITEKLIYMFSRFIKLNNKIDYINQYLKAKKTYIRNKGKKLIENADIRIWYYGAFYKLFQEFHNKDILFFVGITYPFLSQNGAFALLTKTILQANLDMQPFCITESNFIKQSLINLGFKSKDIYILPLFHNFNLNYIKHKHNIIKLLTYGRYATNKAIPELAETCKKNNIYFSCFGDNEHLNEFKSNYDEAKKYENKRIRILPKQPEIDKFFNNSNIFISNSYHEGFLMPAIESMAHSLPLLIRRGTAPDDFFINKKYPPGLQFDNVSEIPQLAEKIINNYEFYANNSYNLSKKYTLKIYEKRLFNILNIYLKWRRQ